MWENRFSSNMSNVYTLNTYECHTNIAIFPTASSTFTILAIEIQVVKKSWRQKKMWQGKFK